jgi:hypothetical protein
MMEPAATALMILLACSPDALDCREVQLARAYESIVACREALPQVVKRLSSERSQVVGRCTLAADAAIPGIDPMITGSAARGAVTKEGYTTVRVTRLDGRTPSTRIYEVPKADR